MKVVMIHNAYGRPSGEEAVVQTTTDLLRERGNQVTQFGRSSAEIPQMRFGKARAFFSGVYSRSAKLAMHELIDSHQPDVAHVHNVFPLLSPAVLVACREAGLPVVMTAHNYRLVCPTGLHTRNGSVCEECAGGREYHCVLHNCTGNFFKSLGYALRTYVARRRRWFLDNVTLHVALTEFQRKRLIAADVPPERTIVIPNMAEVESFQPNGDPGAYVGYVGRVSPEKAVHLLVEAGRACPDMQFRIAGGYQSMPELAEQAPENVEFVGHLSKPRLQQFYEQSRMLVLCSTWFECFPVVLAEAMLHARPVVCSRIGGLPEIVDDGETGLLFEPGDVGDLTEKIRYLWERPDLCQQMGEAGRQKALREYSADTYYERLMGAYRKAIALGPGGASNG